MNILGVNAWHADASAVLVRDGELVAAVEEERFRRIRHCAGFPAESIRACLAIGGITGRDVDHVAVSRDPRAHLWRKARFALRYRPHPALLRDRAANYRALSTLPHRLRAALDLPPADPMPTIHVVEHHAAHLASAFDVSPFDEAAVCAADGFGDFVSTSWALGRGHDLRILRRTYFPHSLGLLYLAITQYLGFRTYGDEYKVMGLAPYGRPDYADAIRSMLHTTADGDVRLDLRFFRHTSGHAGMSWADGQPVVDRVFSARVEAALGPAREADGPITPRHEAVAASLQVVFEDALFDVLRRLHERTRLRRLCLAGGCALNGVATGKIRERTPFEELYVQPAAADNGTALGAAFHVWHRVLGGPRGFVMRHAYWGPDFSDAAVEAEIDRHRTEFLQRGCSVRRSDDPAAICDWTAARLADGFVVGWFQGRMEWGARALGNRSILGDPRRAEMRDLINAKIKRREAFRPFAPSVLAPARDRYFAGAPADPFMTQVHAVRAGERSALAAVTHVDGTSRPQIVTRDDNPPYWRLIEAFERLTGVPALLNTSFNESEPIVHRPAEALACFLRTGLDALVVGPFVVAKPHVGERPHDAVA